MFLFPQPLQLSRKPVNRRRRRKFATRSNFVETVLLELLLSEWLKQ